MAEPEGFYSLYINHLCADLASSENPIRMVCRQCPGNGGHFVTFVQQWRYTNECA
jgi:hypothetical protein